MSNKKVNNQLVNYFSILLRVLFRMLLRKAAEFLHQIPPAQAADAWKMKKARKRKSKKMSFR